MGQDYQIESSEYRDLQLLWEGGGRAFWRGFRQHQSGANGTVLLVSPTMEPAPKTILERLAHEYELRDLIAGIPALRPLALERHQGRTFLALEDFASEPLTNLLNQPLEIGPFLRLALAIAATVGQLHRAGLVHKDINPSNILLNRSTGEIKLTGFGIASRLVRERQSLDPPEVIAGTLPYMAPEQTGRMNRSIDSRSDLYSLGVIFCQALTGGLPFSAKDPMEWVHCHIARQPLIPPEQIECIPPAVLSIISKLLAKTAEDRYQTASGLEHDLRICLDEWETRGSISSFPLGQRDVPDRLLISEKLYGREREVSSLLAAFERVARHGITELVMVSGYSGIGKSSIVNELHRTMVPLQGLFSVGKFDQLKRNIPYATIAQAFQALVRQLLRTNKLELARWREALLEALEANGQIMVDLIPELALVIGDQPPVPELPPQEAHNRLRLTFRHFLGVFANVDHPLVLFLDDLQWVDMATLDLIEYIAADPSVKHLLLVGAYRDNEVDTSHPLTRTLGGLRRGPSRFEEITLGPLKNGDLTDLIADALREELDVVQVLSDLVVEKTDGNPFFAIQFLNRLVEESLLIFDYETSAWNWNIDRIRDKGFTDNVVELMAGRLSQLPTAAFAPLTRLACLGSNTAAATVAMILKWTEAKVHQALWEVVRLGLVVRQGDAYVFLHDRVQEAAYSLIPKEIRGKTHLQIGRALLAQTSKHDLPESAFEIANQFARGQSLITSARERRQVAQLYLMAGTRARASAAYTSAIAHFNAGISLLSDRSWTRNYELMFNLKFHLAECQFLNHDLATTDSLLGELLQNAISNIDLAKVYKLKIDLHVVRSDYVEAIQAAIECLALLGITLSPHPPRDELDKAYAEIRAKLVDRPIEALIDLPRLTDPNVEAAMNVLSSMYNPAFFTDEILASLHLCHMVALTLDHGVTGASASGLATFGIVLGHVYGDYEEGYQFANVARSIIKRHDFAANEAVTLWALEIVSLWTRPVSEGIAAIRAAFKAGVNTGDLMMACYACNHLITDLLLRGDPLEDVGTEIESCLAFARRAGFRDVVDVIIGQKRFVMSMRGLTNGLSTFNGEDFNETEYELSLTDERATPMVFWYWIIKGQTRYIAGQFGEAEECFRKAAPLVWGSPGHIQLLDYHFFAALTVAALQSNDQLGGGSHDELTHHCDRLAEWARSGPQTFADKHALVSAEIARCNGQHEEAALFYEKAIRLAKLNGFVQIEAIASELTARFYAGRNLDQIADFYLRNARSCYERWGAIAKVRQLDETHPQLRESVGPSTTTHLLDTQVDQLDLLTVIKVLQLTSSEVVLEKLLDALMRTALEQAGAERGLLILTQEETDTRLLSEATVKNGSISVRTMDERLPDSALPVTVLRYVMRSGEGIVLEDACTDRQYSQDEYIQQHQTRSLLCIPMMNQGELIGILYLENSLTPGLFGPKRTAVLMLMASQAAISLQNSRLYRDLAEREAKIRRLVDANIIGIFIWSLEGHVIEANSEFLRILGYDHSDVTDGKLRWTDLTPSDWLDRDQKLRVPELQSAGIAQPYEKEFFHKDGHRVPVLIGLAMLQGNVEQGVAFVLDLSARKQAEADAREAEHQLRESQMELAHANRVATMGHLTASIAHEVRQPIAATSANAEAARRFLQRHPPNIQEVGDALTSIVADSNRASEIISRIHGIVKKIPPQKEQLEINSVIREVVELTRGETSKHGILVETQFQEQLPFLTGDKVQLQQVILNLIINAVDAMSSVNGHDRRLLISTEMAGLRGVVVTVSDTGPGLSETALQQVFNAFYTTKPSGFGLGLSISRSIVEAHGGALSARANETGGATFHFSLAPHEGADEF